MKISWNLTIDGPTPDGMTDPQELMDWASSQYREIENQIFYGVELGPVSVDGFVVYDDDGDLVVEHDG